MKSSLLRHVAAAALALLAVSPMAGAVVAQEAVFRVQLKSKIIFVGDGGPTCGVEGLPPCGGTNNPTCGVEGLPPCGGTNNGPLELYREAAEVRALSTVNLPVTVVGGTAPYTIEVSGLPSGLSYDPDLSSIVGQTTYVGVSSLSFTATDSLGATDVVSDVLLTTISPLFATASVPTVYAGEAFTISPSAIGLIGVGTWDRTGFDNTDLSFNTETGQIAGIVQEDGAIADLTLGVTDSYDGLRAATDPFTINVLPAAIPSVSVPAVQTGYTGRAFTLTPSVTDLRLPATWSYTGTLPTWAAFNTSTGVITGTPPALVATASNLKIKVVGSNGRFGETAAFSVQTSYPYSITVPTGVTWRQGTAKTAQLTSTATTPTWTLPTGPAWLSVNASTGVISGTPTAAGAFSYTTHVAQSGWAEASGSITVLAPITFSTQPGNISVQAGNTAVSGQTPAFSGDAPVVPAFTLTDNSGNTATVPAWLTINTSGRVTAAPASAIAAGTYGPYLVKVTDQTGGTAQSSSFNVTVTAANPFGAIAYAGTVTTDLSSFISCILTGCSSGSLQVVRNGSGSTNKALKLDFVGNQQRFVSSVVVKLNSNADMILRTFNGTTEVDTPVTSTGGVDTTRTITIGRNTNNFYFFCSVACTSNILQVKPNF